MAAIDAIIGGLGLGVGMESIRSGSYDYYNTYYQFPREFTDIIDTMISTRSQAKMCKRIVTHENKCIPGLGKHYFYFANNSWIHYVTFAKNQTENGHCEYTCYVSPFQLETFKSALKVIFTQKKGQIRVISIDTSLAQPFPMYIEKRCKSARTHQTSALNMILDHYKSKNSDNEFDFNTKVIICGERKSGKTYLGRLLKKKMETDCQKNVHLYDDFNPSSIGSNISRLILQNATVKTNVITLIDEIDVSYKAASKETESNQRDGRLLHTQNKQTLNQMFEAIESKTYVVALYTTEMSPEELYEKEEWRSFFREGRVDFIIKFVREDNATDIANETDTVNTTNTVNTKNIKKYKCVKVNHSDLI